MSVGEVRVATEQEHDLIYGASIHLIETFKKANMGPDMALNILIAAVAHIIVIQTKEKLLEDVIDLTIDGLRKQVASFQRNYQEQEGGQCMN